MNNPPGMVGRPIKALTTLPIAEVFTSVHGEGAWAGTPMTFIRLAGCTVGKNVGNIRSTTNPPLMPILPTGNTAWECTTFDGRRFPCDTDFHKRSDQTVQQLMDQIPMRIKHVCITGGEPLMHIEKLLTCGLVEQLIRKGITVHFETSGTIMLPPDWINPYEYGDIYIACSPKFNYLEQFIFNYADEVRLMVDKNFNEAEAMMIAKLIRAKGNARLFLAPISKADDTTDFDPESLQKCMELLEIFPEASISIQMHKVLGVR